MKRMAAQEALEANQYVRIAACNACFDPHLREARFAALAEIFEDLRLDAVCVQEVPLEKSEAHLQLLTGGTGLRVAAYAEGSITGNAVLLRGDGSEETPIVVEDNTTSVNRFTGAYAVARWEKHGHTIRSCSVHQPWGGLQEALRIQAAVRIEEEFEKRVRCDVEHIAGDFNAEPGAASIRYLTGATPVGERAAQWTDAWVHSGEGDGHTSSPVNPYVRIVGAKHGFADPRMLPERRIDYIFLRGYVHGNVGTPLRTFVHREGRAETGYPSDHWMVVSDLYAPLGDKTKRQSGE